MARRKRPKNSSPPKVANQLLDAAMDLHPPYKKTFFLVGEFFRIAGSQCHEFAKETASKIMENLAKTEPEKSAADDFAKLCNSGWMYE